MIERIVNPLKSNSFFMFGARGTGKTYFLERYLNLDESLYIDLLDPEEEHRLVMEPDELKRRIDGLAQTLKWVFIDEIQKIPKLLDLVHSLIEKTDLLFALSGSSARKLKRGGANLLAGRAFVYHMFPLTTQELGERFDLISALQWGTLPGLLKFESNQEKQLFLRSYANTYLKEEIAAEQVVRKLEPFQRFLQVAAQTDGQIINFARIARDVGVSIHTVQSYFQILEETLIGISVPPFHESVRKRQRGNPKFYLFDNGVKRALDRTLTVELLPQTYAFGLAFENFIINEVYRLQVYYQRDYELSYLRTHDDAEIDLVIERPGLPRALVEIKSSVRITPDDLKHLISLGKDIPNQESFCFSRDPKAQVISGVNCLPWQKGLEEIGL
jgi:predicted AAA+ superfamily ATPase